MTNIISHPGKPLIIHLREVARFCFKTLKSKKFNLAIDADILQKLAFIQGAVHDIGKGTKNFQTYIKSNGEIINRPKHHALISAFVAREISKHYLKDLAISEFDKSVLPNFIFTSVKRHHGNVLNFSDELEKLREKEDDLRILTNNFFEEEIQIILDDLLSEIGLQYSWKAFKNYMNDLEKVFFDFDFFSIEVLKDEFRNLTDSKRAEYFYLHHTFFSSLLLSDKTDVKLGMNKGARFKKFDFDAISSFRAKKGWNNPSDIAINQLKNQAYYEGIKQLNKIFTPNQHLYSITLPTGLGKTITSLAIAMEMKKILPIQNPRIVITIPFTSIIDQNYEVFNEIFQNPSSDILLKHHHLAEPKYKSNEDDEVKSTEVSQFLIETWQSEIVVTTFVQLLESIFTNRKGKLMKLPNLMNSIIILDEIQQIPFEYWELIRTAFNVLGKQFNCYFILMSATQPLIFAPEKEIREIIPQYQQYFRFFNRTKLVNKARETISLNVFCDIVIKYHQNNHTKDILVILNTREVTLNCFKKIAEHIDETQCNLYFLTTLITPFERKQIIRRIKNPPNDLPNIIISTQLIEAGVDISVHTVFRAMAPLDSIIQAAGRANRYGENKKASEVFLYRIEELEKVTNRLYGAVLMNKTHLVLNAIETVEESEYLQLIEAYFLEIKKQSENMTCDTREDLLDLKFEDVGKFDFIAYRKTESVFIQLSAKARNVWQSYRAIYSNQQLTVFEKREQFALIKAQFYDYVINVPVDWDKEHIIFDSEPEMHFYVSKLDSPSKCYSYNSENFRANTGYQAIETHTANY